MQNTNPLCDRFFETYTDADTFAARCGFPHENERKLGPMLLFKKDVYDNYRRLGAGRDGERLCS